MSEFRNRGLEVVVDTTKEAEWDFLSRRIPQTTQERVAQSLKRKPLSLEDACIGSLRIRKIEKWDIGFTVSQDGSDWVVTIWAVELPGELESHTLTLLRAAKAGLPEPLQVLIEGRIRK